MIKPRTKPKPKVAGSTRVHVIVPNALLDRFKEARWARRLPSLSETIRTLAEEALAK